MPQVQVAYQGAEGAYSEEAIWKFFPEAETVGFATFHEVFTAVSQGELPYGVVPVENSVAGSINQTYDLLLASDLHVVGEVILRVRHCLLALPGAEIGAIKQVLSHPQALAQCDGFLSRHQWQSRPVYDTAGAAARLAEIGDLGTAAIASQRAAEHYGLKVLAHGIEDFDFNYTRFFVLAPETAHHQKGAYKTSLVFAMRQRRGHSPGGLIELLQPFAQAGVSLSKLESRPRRDRAWSYVFYVDLEGNVADPNLAQALIELLREAAFVKVLGSYPKAAEEPEG